MVAPIILHERISVYSLALSGSTTVAAPPRSRKMAGRLEKLARSILFTGMSLSQSCRFFVSRKRNHERFVRDGGRRVSSLPLANCAPAVFLASDRKRLPGSHLLSPRVEGLGQRTPERMAGVFQHSPCAVFHSSLAGRLLCQTAHAMSRLRR